MKKKRILKRILLLAMLVGMMFVATGCSKISPNDPTDKENMFKGARDAAIWMYNSLFEADYYSDLNGKNDYLATPKDEKKTNTFTLAPSKIVTQTNLAVQKYFFDDQIEGSADYDQGAANAQAFLNTVTDVLEGAAIGFLIIVWLMTMLNNIMNDCFSAESMLKSFMQFMAGALLTLNAKYIANVFFMASNEILNMVSQNSAGGVSFGAFKQQQLDALMKEVQVMDMKGLSWLGIDPIVLDFQPIGVIFSLLFPIGVEAFLAYKLISILVLRAFELTARITMAPIPIALSFKQGFSDETFQYFKEVLVCALHPLLIIIGVASLGGVTDIVLKVFGSSATTATGIIAVFGICFGYFILSVYVGQSKGLIHDIIRNR